MVDEVTDKEAGNFCDYYRPLEQPRQATSGEAAQARTRLAALFDREAEPISKGTVPVGDALADKSGEDSAAPDAAAAARAKLDAIFGKKDG